MTRQVKKNQSIFPDFPRHPNILNDDGTLSAPWNLGLSSLFQAAQNNFSNEGFKLPLLSTEDSDSIKQIYTNLIGKKLSDTNPATPNISGSIIYNIDDEIPKIFIIKFDPVGDPNGIIKGGLDAPDWKTFTIT